MKNKLSRILCTALCCAPLLATAQTSENITSPQRLYQEGQSLFQQKAYAAAIPPLQAFVRQIDAEGSTYQHILGFHPFACDRQGLAFCIYLAYKCLQRWKPSICWYVLPTN